MDIATPDQIPSAATALPPADRRFEGRHGSVNWLGLWTLYLKEVRRFLNVHTQTIAAPVVTTLLFLAVFALALGRDGAMVQGVPYAAFLAPGLIMMAMTQNSFANTSSSITIGKVQGNIVDVLMPPLSALELTVGYAAAGVTRAAIVGVVVGAAMAVFVPIGLAAPGYILFHGVAGSLMLALLGVIGGIWSMKFDHIAAVTNFVVTPAAFLSGTFYSIARLPEPWATVAHLNPFFYMIDGFRFGFIGTSDANPLIGVAVLLTTNLALGLVAWRMFATGYRLKA